MRHSLVSVVICGIVLAGCQSTTTGTGGTSTTGGSSGSGGSTSTGGSGGSGSTSTGGSGGSGGTGGGSTTTGPKYLTNGVVATESNSLALINVIEMDTNNGNTAQNNRSGSPSDFQLVFDPSTGTVSIYSQGQAYDGTIDAESMTFSNNNWGSGAPNFVRMSIGDYSYMFYGMIDQNDGRFRHDFATAGGQIYATPTSGTALFQGFFGGVLEKYDGSVSYQYPLIGDGNATVNFGTGYSTILFNIDSSRSNGVSGTIAGYQKDAGDALSGGQFAGFANFIPSTPTGSAYVEGDYAGFVAGPDSDEVAGTIQMQSTSGSATAYSVVGGFLAEE